MMASGKLKVLILGATSAVAEATARLYAAEGAALVLAGRDTGRLETIAADLRLRGAAETIIADLDLAGPPPEKLGALFSGWAAQLGGIDHAIIAYGVLGDQVSAETDPVIAASVLRTNFTSAALWTLTAADYFAKQGHGSLVVLGSVAGDRGRRLNYVYGSAKAGLAALVEGIAHRFGNGGPKAVIVKPGPIDTPMTAGMKKGGPLWSAPGEVAKIVRRAADGRRVVVYAPERWRYIMLIIRFMPRFIFNRMKF